MRKSNLFPLLSGLVLTMTVGCGDDGSDDTTNDSNDTDTTAEDASSQSTATDDTNESDESSESDTDTTTVTSDSTDTSTDSETPDGGGASDGGGEATDGGADDADGGATDSDDGGDADAGADAEADAEPPLPEDACAESPPNPEEGTYAGCDRTLNGGTCQLTCDDDNYVGGIATCTDGVWSEATCIELGSLTAEIGNAATGADLADAIVYIEGFYDPASDNCEPNVYCDITDSNGVVEFDGFPSGDQKVVIVKTGFDEIALPVNISPGSDRSIHLDALPTNFLAGNIVVLLGWESSTDLELLLAVPGETVDSDAGADAGAGPVSCVFRADSRRGSLTAAPFARLESDSKPPTRPRGPETVRIAPNADNSGPYYDGTYSVVVMSASGVSLSDAQPSVRVIRAGQNGGADVTLFTLPVDAVGGATEWHVLDLEGFVATAVGTTEVHTEGGETNLPCVEEGYTIAN